MGLQQYYSKRLPAKVLSTPCIAQVQHLNAEVGLSVKHMVLNGARICHPSIDSTYGRKKSKLEQHLHMISGTPTKN